MARAFVLTVAVALTIFELPVASASAPATHPHQSSAELHSRSVKALSERQMADLRAGRGMGLALAAELNGYPGPRHVLEHVDALGLSPTQRERTKVLFEAMKAETVPLGERLIELETELDWLFASKAITPAGLDTLMRAFGATQGALSAAHLRYHLAMMDVLTSEQVQHYGKLRGSRPE